MEENNLLAINEHSTNLHSICNIFMLTKLSEISLNFLLQITEMGKPSVPMREHRVEEVIEPMAPTENNDLQVRAVTTQLGTSKSEDVYQLSIKSHCHATLSCLKQNLISAFWT